MSAKVKVKKVKISAAMKDEDITTMFNQMVGAGHVNLHIAYPRYLRLKTACTKMVSLFRMLAETTYMKIEPGYDYYCGEINEFCDSIDLDMFSYTLDPDAATEDEQREFTNIYEKMKKSRIITISTLIYDRLIPYTKYVSDAANLNHKFVLNMPGVEWKPFPFTNLNIKEVFSSINISSQTIKLFMAILCKSYTLSREIYTEISTPDIDIDRFVDIIMANITELQKRPELDRCKRAFHKIVESVDLLKREFNGYYRDFIATKDSTIMMQHFIMDVSKETNADPRLTLEFRRIISYYRKIAKDQIKNPKIKSMFDKVNSYFTEIEQGTENIDKDGVKIEDEYSDVESSGEE